MSPSTPVSRAASGRRLMEPGPGGIEITATREHASTRLTEEPYKIRRFR